MWQKGLVMTQGGDEVRRRLLVRLMGAIGDDQPAGSLERLAAFGEQLIRRGPVDAATLDAFETVTATCAREYTQVPPQRLAPLLRSHVDRTAARLDLPMTPSLRARLGAVVAETAALTGWTLHVAGRRGEAHALFTLTREVARDAGHDVLHALALGSMSSLYTAINRGSLGGSRVALRLLEQAVIVAPAHTPGPALAWLHGRLAEERAVLGDADGFARALADSERHNAATAGTGDLVVFGPDSVLSFWAPGGTGPAHVKGFGLGVLGRPGGVGALDRLVARTPDPVGRTTLLGDLATAHLHAGDPDAALVTAIEAAGVARAGGLHGRLDRVRGLRSRFPHGLAGLDALDERLAPTG